MPVIQSELDVHGAAFAQNRETMLATIAGFREVEQKVLDKANEAKAKFEKRGQLLPRERINLLLDPGAPFLELASLAGYKLHDDKDGSMAGGGLIAGIGYIQGVRSLVIANNSAIKGGTISPSGLKKGSSRFSGEGRLDFQEEVIRVPEAIGHAFDHLDAVVHPFQQAGMHVEAGAGEDASGVAPEVSGKAL